MSVRFSSRTLPGDAHTKNSSALPFGCVVMPFAEQERAAYTSLPHASDLGRCEQCGGFVNPFCKFTCNRERRAVSWKCSLCLHDNDSVPPRYASIASQSSHLAEVKSRCLDVRFDFDAEQPTPTTQQQQQQSGAVSGAGVAERAVYVFVVDVAAGPDFVELAKSGLMAALEAVPRGSAVGLVALSSTLAIFDLAAPFAVVKHVTLSGTHATAEGDEREDGGTPSSLGIEEVLPLASFLIALDDAAEDRLLGCIESLDSLCEARGEESGGFAFGPAVETLVQYFEAYEDLRCARVAFLLNSLPSSGRGKLVASYNELAPQTLFYRRQGARAARAGLAFDIFAMGPEARGLPSIKFLATETGGELQYYESAAQCTLPQDIFRLYRSRQAFDCQLRLRTGNEFAVSRSLNLTLSQESGVYDIAVCSPHHSFSFDLAYETASGIALEKAVLQMTFAYSELVPVASLVPKAASAGQEEEQANANDNNDSSNNNHSNDDAPALQQKYVIRRFLRILTRRCNTTLSWRLVYPSVQPDVVCALLLHKTIRAVFDENRYEAGELLKDWLISMLVKYNENMVQRTGQVSMSMGHFGTLKMFPRYIYGLLQCPLLRHAEAERLPSDQWCAVQVLWGRCQPRHFMLAVYPLMSSWPTVEKMQSQQILLNNASLAASGCKWFLVDAFSEVCVHRAAGAEESPEAQRTELDSFMRQKESALYRALNKTKQDRPLMPHTTVCSRAHGGEMFEALLVEERGETFSSFIGQCEVSVRRMLQKK